MTAGAGSGGSGSAGAVLESLPDPVVVCTPDGYIDRLNTPFGRLLDADPGTLVGGRADERIRLVDETGADWWRCARPFAADPRLLPRIPERPLTLTTVAERIRPVLLTGSRVPGENGGLAALVLALRRGERRERLEAVRSDLISTVSHELRSPLTSVKGFTKTLLARWDRFDDNQKRQMLATMNADADRVTRLLTELLDVSRIDAGRLPLSRRMISLADIVEPLAERLRIAGDAQIDVQLPPDLPALYVDEDKLSQVFANLFENAQKYGSGTIRVSAAVEEDSLRFTVADEGGAIDPGTSSQLFTKFFRGAGHRRSGTGLGLYICKGIVEAHGGRIWAESDPGRQTRLCFTLPRGGLELAGVAVSHHDTNRSDTRGS